MNNKEVQLECSPKLSYDPSKVNCVHPPLHFSRIGSHKSSTTFVLKGKK